MAFIKYMQILLVLLVPYVQLETELKLGFNFPLAQWRWSQSITTGEREREVLRSADQEPFHSLTSGDSTELEC